MSVVRVTDGHAAETAALRALLGELEGLGLDGAARLGLFGGVRRWWKKQADIWWVSVKKIRDTCVKLTSAQKACSEAGSQFDQNTSLYWNVFTKVLFEPFDTLHKRDYVLRLLTAWARVKPGLYFYLYQFQHDELDTGPSKLHLRDLMRQMDQIGRTWKKELEGYKAV